MTKLKIKEKSDWYSGSLDEEDYNNLEAGDMIYSYNWDILILVVKTEDDDFLLVNLKDGQIINTEGSSYFKEYVSNYIDQFGDFFSVSKAKITFKVGE